MLAVFGRIDPQLRRSITFDNDTAFAQHALLRTMRDMTTWFCDAYASWQKGGIENANGRLRRWLPRHLDIDRTSDQDIQEIVLTTNLTPPKMSRVQDALPSLDCRSLTKGHSNPLLLNPLRFAPESRLPGIGADRAGCSAPRGRQPDGALHVEGQIGKPDLYRGPGEAIVRMTRSMGPFCCAKTCST